MKMSDTVRMILLKGNIAQGDLATQWGYVSKQSMNNKFSRGSWSANELANLAELTGGKLLVRYPDGQEIPVEPESDLTKINMDGEV